MVAAVTLGASIGGIAYLAVALRCVAVFGRRKIAFGGRPSVTILKPLCGLEPALYENLCSFCDQDYGPFQVIFGVRDAGDPAIAIAQRVRQRFPDRDIALVIGGDAPAANPKVANLLNMIVCAKGDVLVMADSDMRVEPGYLPAIAAPFGNPKVGAVTCLYSGAPLRGLASALGAMFINEHFAPSVLVALELGELSFALGATIAIRREVLAVIGGLEALAPHLADDYVLGKLVHEAGWIVALSPYVVRNTVCEPSITALWCHELRWARTIRAVRPVGYAFSGITYALPLALLSLLLGPNRTLGSVVVLAAASLRVALAQRSRAALQVTSPDTPWLIPLRDIMAFAVWVCSFGGRRVHWRADEFALEAGGRLHAKKRPAPCMSKRPV